jgi:hypothetical protein
MEKKQLFHWELVLALALALIIFIPSVKNEFVYDDIPYLRNRS